MDRKVKDCQSNERLAAERLIQFNHLGCDIDIIIHYINFDCTMDSDPASFLTAVEKENARVFQ